MKIEKVVGRPYRKNYKATGRKIPKGWEIHHIVPRSEGGTDEASNLVCLHPSIHKMVHEILDKHKSNRKKATCVSCNQTMLIHNHGIHIRTCEGKQRARTNNGQPRKWVK